MRFINKVSDSFCNRLEVARNGGDEASASEKERKKKSDMRERRRDRGALIVECRRIRSFKSPRSFEMVRKSIGSGASFSFLSFILSLPDARRD